MLSIQLKVRNMEKQEIMTQKQVGKKAHKRSRPTIKRHDGIRI